MSLSRRARSRVVIVGGGFAGLHAAKSLARAQVEVTLIDRTNHHLFQPLLYQVATAALSAGDVAAPIRKVLRRQRNARVILGEVTGVDLEGRRVLLEGSAVAYDHLVLAAGATLDYFGHDDWRAFAPGLKGVEDAVELRRRVLLAYEHAEAERAQGARGEWLTFVVVGGGPTGVELAGAIAEIATKTLTRDFRSVDTRQTKVILLDGADRLLSTYPPKLSERARDQLEALGVEVRVGVMVTDISARGVETSAGSIAARTVLWAAGVKASPLGEGLGAPLDGAGRVEVSADLSLPGHPEVFVVGDMARLTSRGEVVPGVAPAAIQAGRQAAENILRRIEGQGTKPFTYVDGGSLATIGRARAVARLGRLQVSGFLAWALWLFVHVLFLVGFRNRVAVMLEWAWAYLSWQRSNRVIFEARPSRWPVLSEGCPPECREPRCPDRAFEPTPTRSSGRREEDQVEAGRLRRSPSAET